MSWEEVRKGENKAAATIKLIARFLISEMSYKRFYVHLLLFKGTPVLRQAQIFQHVTEIHKLVPIFFELLFSSWRAGSIISLCNGGWHLQQEAEILNYAATLVFPSRWADEMFLYVLNRFSVTAVWPVWSLHLRPVQSVWTEQGNRFSGWTTGQRESENLPVQKEKKNSGIKKGKPSRRCTNWSTGYLPKLCPHTDMLPL